MLKKENKAIDMDSILKGNGPRPTEKAEKLEQFAKEDGANSMSAWLLSFSLPSAWNSLF